MIIRMLCAPALAATYVDLRGKSINGVLVEDAPGGTSPAHIHPASAFIYVKVPQGAIRSWVNRVGRDLSRRQRLLRKSRRATTRH